MRISDWSSDVCSSDLVERARFADAFEQLEVVVAVRVEKAVVEIEAVFGGQFLGREHLAFTEAQWADDLAGEHPVLDLVRRTFDVGDAKIARGRFDLVDRRRRDDRDAVALCDRKSTRLNSSH